MTDSNFDKALIPLLHAEGGYYDGSSPGDSNPTNYGITQRVYDQYHQSLGLAIQPVLQISMDEVKDIYYHRYWLKAGCDQLKWPVCWVLFDGAVNEGPTTVIKMLQGIVGTNQDGQIGPLTEAAANKRDSVTLALQLIIERWEDYTRLAKAVPADVKFLLGGWSKRLWDCYVAIKVELV